MNMHIVVVTVSPSKLLPELYIDTGVSIGLAYYAHHAAYMAQALGLYDEASIANMSRSIEEYQQLVTLRTVAKQLFDLVSGQ
jgi:hypothetical protein